MTELRRLLRITNTFCSYILASGLSKQIFIKFNYRNMFTKNANSHIAPQLAGSAEDNVLIPNHELNCDMGEAFGPWKMGPDEELMPIIDAANIACGGHAGDPQTMLKTVRLAKRHGVRVGAHPGLPDPLGFGRRRWSLSPEEVFTLILYQVGALQGIARAEDVEVSYIKPHGELYFYIERDDEIMKAALRAAKTLGLPVMGGKSKRYLEMAHEFGVKFIQEAYADLNYTPFGALIKPPSEPKFRKTPEVISNFVLRAGEADQAVDTEGNIIDLNFDGAHITFCLHSDIPGVLENATAARKAIDTINKRKYGV